MREMLAIGKQMEGFNQDIKQNECSNKLRNPSTLANFLGKHLHANRFIEVWMEDCNVDEKSLGHDHWFSVIGSGDTVYLVEYSSNECQVYQVYNLPNFVKWLSDVMIGKIPDRFYNEANPHTIRMRSFNRHL